MREQKKKSCLNVLKKGVKDELKKYLLVLLYFLILLRHLTLNQLGLLIISEAVTIRF